MVWKKDSLVGFLSGRRLDTTIKSPPFKQAKNLSLLVEK